MQTPHKKMRSTTLTPQQGKEKKVGIAEEMLIRKSISDSHLVSQ
jgi:hypothetical protein